MYEYSASTVTRSRSWCWSAAAGCEMFQQLRLVAKHCATKQDKQMVLTVPIRTDPHKKVEEGNKQRDVPATEIITVEELDH